MTEYALSIWVHIRKLKGPRTCAYTLIAIIILGYQPGYPPQPYSQDGAGYSQAAPPYPQGAPGYPQPAPGYPQGAPGYPQGGQGYPQGYPQGGMQPGYPQQPGQGM